MSDELKAIHKEVANFARKVVRPAGIELDRLQLFDMFTKIEAARAYASRMSAYNALNPPGSARHAIAAKVLSTQTFLDVTREAVSIYGGNGLAREYPIEKMLRDAIAATIEDGENNALSLLGAADL